MVFACQKDCYLQTLETRIVSCTPCDGKSFVVVLEDTVLFPEGGGQPEDHGTINGINVALVKRKGEEALHYVQESIAVGSCTVAVDWKRRFDHMQQHTGQHLITAVAERMMNYRTTSWNLGEQISYIELDVPSISDDNIFKLEQVLNDKIRSCIPVTIHLYDKDDVEISQVRTRLKLPDDHTGPIRVVKIGDIDNNTCCGTHVKNTSELQMIKLLYAEKGKKKNKTNLFFVVGQRVLNYMEKCVSSQRCLSSLLSCGSDEVVDMVQKLQRSLKLSKKNLLLSSRELATMEAKGFKLSGKKPIFFALHKKNVEPEFMSIFLNEVDDTDIVFFLTVDDGKSGGQMTLTGPPDVVQKYGPQICEILDGKGSGKNRKYQAKFKKYANISKAEDLLKSVINIENEIEINTH